MEAPASLDELHQQFLRSIKELSQNKRTIIVIDALNQMQGEADMLDWVPDILPEGLKLIVSIKNDDSKEQIEQSKRYFSFHVLHLETIQNDEKGTEQKRKLITE
jgi:hypothetical protein